MRVVIKVEGPLNAFMQAGARGLLAHRGSGRTLEWIDNPHFYRTPARWFDGTPSRCASTKNIEAG